MIGTLTPKDLLTAVVGRVDVPTLTVSPAVRTLFPGANSGSKGGGVYSTNEPPLNMTRPPEPGFLDNLKHGDPKTIAIVGGLALAVVAAVAYAKKKRKR